jgi:hypothetical protein
MQSILLKVLMWAIPTLGGPLAQAIVAAVVGIGQEEVSIMLPVVKAFITAADDPKQHPELTSGPQKFVWVFEQSVEAFPSANSKALGTLINVVVQEIEVIVSAI